MRKPRRTAVSNLALFSSADLVADYQADKGLTAAERVLIDRWIPSNTRVLDLGVGAGRTYCALAARASDYVGVDYSEEMVRSARARYPQGRFEMGDATDLAAFDSASFDAVVFSYNGIDYLHPASGRAACLGEIHRVLRPGGVLILSSHNARAVFSYRAPDRQGLPAAFRSAALSVIASARASRSLATSATFWRGSGARLDRIRPLLTHYSTPAIFTRELSNAGFDVMERLAGDHPRPLRQLSSAWTYVAAMKPSGNVVRIEYVGADAISSIAHDWDRLAASGGSAFQTRAWFEAWWRHLEAGAHPYVLVARDEAGRVVGLLPLAQQSRRFHQRVPIELRFIGLAGAGSGAADHLGPLVEDDSVAHALFAHLGSSATSTTILLENLAPRWAPIAHTAIGGSVVGEVPCPVAVRDEDGRFDDAWTPKMHKNARRRSRRIEAASISANWVPAGRDFEDKLSELRMVHTMRWSAAGTSGLFDRKRERFLADYARRANKPDAPWILALEQRGQVVAALLAFRHRQTLNVYKTGWDPALSHLGLGIALGAEALRWAQSHGLTEVDYLRGLGSHKFDLGCRPKSDVTVLRRSGLVGLLLEIRERSSAVRWDLVRRKRSSLARRSR